MTKNKAKKEKVNLEAEADEAKQLIANMAKSVEVGSEWYIVSMKWILRWQEFVGFNQGEEEE